MFATGGMAGIQYTCRSNTPTFQNVLHATVQRNRGAYLTGNAFLHLLAETDLEKRYGGTRRK